jgi:hypothetical protein
MISKRSRKTDNRSLRVVAITRADGRTFLLTSARRRDFISHEAQKAAASVLRAKWETFVNPEDTVKVTAEKMWGPQ